MRRRKMTAAAAAAAAPEPAVESNLEDTPDRQASDTPRFPSPWGAVITDIFDLEVHSTLARLTDELSLGDQATEYGSVLAALDKGSKNLFWAARLSRKAKLEDARFAAELDREIEVLRSSAVAQLELEKREGARSKAPTIQDIEDRMLASWPDAVMSLKARKAEMHGAFRAIEGLEQAWRERCAALRALSLQFRAAGG